jgi:hypothetical protein
MAEHEIVYRQKVNDLNGRARKAAGKLGISIAEIGRLNQGDLWAVYEYCGERCQMKGCQNTDVTFDHVEPLEHGGRNSRRNLGLLCESHNKAKGDNIVEDYRAGVICPDSYVAKQVINEENEDYSYETGENENEDLNKQSSSVHSNLSRRGGKRPNSGPKPSAYTLLKERIQEQKIQDAEKAFDLYVQIMENPLEETQMRIAAADRVLDRVLGKATEKSQQERKIIIEIIRENPERQSIDSFARLALSTGTD